MLTCDNDRMAFRRIVECDQCRVQADMPDSFSPGDQAPENWWLVMMVGPPEAVPKFSATYCSLACLQGGVAAQ